MSTYGISNISQPIIFGVPFDTPDKYYYIAMPVMLIAVYFSFSVLRSSVGRAFMAVREDPISAAASGTSAASIDVWGLSLIYAGGFSACTDASEPTVVVAVHDAAFGALGSAIGTYSDEGISYADIYPLSRWTAAVNYSGAYEYVSAQGQSAAEGDCWFLWMSALEGTSYANDGTGYVAGDFPLNYCITE